MVWNEEAPPPRSSPPSPHPPGLAPSCALHLHAVVPSWEEFCAKSQEGLEY